jgi:3-mercaptopyruvate sulfurtransferase SseA
MQKKVGLSIVTIATALYFSGCGSSGDGSSQTKNKTDIQPKSLQLKASSSMPQNSLQDAKANLKKCDDTGVKVYSPHEISMKSNCDYADNEHGVITTKRLKSWIENWQKNRPKGVKGRLIILQAGKISFENNASYLPHNDKDVLVYAIPGGGACDPSYTRFDGISQTPGATLTGEDIDKNINAFQIDPQKDFVVLAVAKGSTAVREITRTWWSMIYWGWDMKRIAFLNGSLEYNFFDNKEYLVANPSPMPRMEHTYKMSSLKTDRTSLHIYMDEMKKIASMDSKKGFFIADARGTGEYSGEKRSKTASKVCGVNHDKQCYTAFRGHIRGAVDFPYTDLLVMDDAKEDINGDGKIDKYDASYKFKNYYEMKKIFKEKGYNGCDTIITYCRTGRKSTILTLAATTILGYPVRMYDGSWIQWGMMAHTQDTNGDTILPASSHVRTDIDKYSVVVGYNNPIDVEPRESYQIDTNSNTTREIVNKDREYLRK